MKMTSGHIIMLKRSKDLLLNNFKEEIKKPKPLPKPKPKEDFWSKFDSILHQILF